MRKTILAASLASAAFAFPSLAAAQATAAPASPHTFTANIGLVTDYRFRAISQTYGKPAIQGGFDYSHSNGLYVGNWNSNINEGAGYPSSKLEMDFYGGWKNTWGDWGVDIGAIYYLYPSSNASVADGTGPIVNPRDPTKTHAGKINNKEIYIGGSWKWLSLKYYHSLGDYFSLPGTKGSNYLDLTATYDLGNGWGVVGHVGSFKLKGWDNGADFSKGNYTDWKIGMTKDINGWVLGATYIDTNAKGSCNLVNPGFYCFSDQAPFSLSKLKDASKRTVVLSVLKTF